MLSGLRNFIIALFAALLIFGLSAYFIIGAVTDYFDDGTHDEDDENNGQTDGDDGEKEIPIDLTEFTVLIIGIDDGMSQRSGRREADTIILANINAKNKELMLSPLPNNMRVEIGDYVLPLNMVYAEYSSGADTGAEMTVDTVWSQTGLKADYFIVLDYAGIEHIFDILGEVDFNVPIDMYYSPAPYDENDDEQEEIDVPYGLRTIDLKKGHYPLNGAQAVQLLRFKNYSGSSRDNETRMRTQMNFIKAVLEQKFTVESFMNANDIYAAIKECIVKTNLGAMDFNRYMDIIFNLSEYSITEIAYPGGIETQYGTIYFKPSRETALKIYEKYRKSIDAINYENQLINE